MVELLILPYLCSFYFPKFRIQSDCLGVMMGLTYISLHCQARSSPWQGAKSCMIIFHVTIINIWKQYETTLNKAEKFKLYEISGCNLNHLKNFLSVKKGKVIFKKLLCIFYSIIVPGLLSLWVVICQVASVIYPTICTLVDHSPPGSSIRGILDLSKNTGSELPCNSLKGLFLIQGSDPHLLSLLHLQTTSPVIPPGKPR